ncbi:hypothetical protein Pan97_33100 [Bremerella volcania]|uniref:Tetratricopeptide repeat-like domain-containing protein n=1 Tax=Bremerella volcania TaxID=2527984 RepID=A0A518CAQ8_9BACT|nr:hypothetical protein [Bremerella volcania]QDU76264.1 hypothetical protein Pan97_33100 [Bremerella volcania]
MKSERRHEIQENSLAHFLEGIVEQAKPHATMIGGVALALLLGFVGYVILNTDSGVVKNEEWSAVYSTLDQSFRVGEDDVKRQEVAQEFATLSTDFGTSRPALWAEYFYGQQNLTQASDLAFSDPQSATADIERALKSFQKVYDSADLPVLKVKALWGMAEAYELQATKESLAKAKSNYEEVMVIWPDTNTSLLAEERIKRLDNQGVDGFYAWYRDQDFVARAAEVERENRAPLEGGLPGMDMNLENPGGGLFDTPGTNKPGAGSDPLFTPSMDLKGAGGEGTAPKPSSFTEKEKEAADKAAEPMGEEKEAATEEKSEEAAKPAAESTEEAPAEEKPAAEQPAQEEAAEEKAE